MVPGYDSYKEGLPSTKQNALLFGYIRPSRYAINKPCSGRSRNFKEQVPIFQNGFKNVQNICLQILC